MSQIASVSGVTIANAASLSGAIVVGGAIVGVQMPASWTTANLTFEVSVDGVTYQDAYNNSGTEINVTAAAARYISVDPDVFRWVKFIKVRSGTVGTPVNQGAERIVQLVISHYR